MERKVFVSISLDKRRIKNNGKYPVKLRVFTPVPRKQKLYATIFEFTEKEFQSIWETSKPREVFKKDRRKLQALETKVNDVIDKITPFSFEAFEKVFFNKVRTDDSNAISIFNEIVNEKSKAGAVSTAEKYQLAKVSIQKFLKYSGLNPEKLMFEQISVGFLKDYERYWVVNKGLSPATIGIYLRNLRAIYNKAVERGAISKDSYPFGIAKDKYTLPTSNKVNKALTETDIKLLWHSEPENEKQAIAKDFWFFSYFCYGMNTRDICELKHTSINGENINYVRAKTRTTKRERTIKQVPITNSIAAIIERRKTDNSKFLFGVIDEKLTPKQVHERIKNFNDLINKHFRIFAIKGGLDQTFAEQIGTYHARHSFATIAIRKGNSMELISEILHDGNLTITQNYINTFPKETFKELSKELEI